jgi:hypothetical protein
VAVLRWHFRDWPALALLIASLVSVVLASSFTFFAFGHEEEIALRNMQTTFRGFAILAPLLALPRLAMTTFNNEGLALDAIPRSQLRQLGEIVIVHLSFVAVSLLILAVMALVSLGLKRGGQDPAVQDLIPSLTQAFLLSTLLTPVSLFWSTVARGAAVYMINLTFFTLAALKARMPLPSAMRSYLLAPLPDVSWFDPELTRSYTSMAIEVTYCGVIGLGYLLAAAWLLGRRSSRGDS